MYANEKQHQEGQVGTVMGQERYGNKPCYVIIRWDDGDEAKYGLTGTHVDGSTSAFHLKAGQRVIFVGRGESVGGRSPSPLTIKLETPEYQEQQRLRSEYAYAMRNLGKK